MLKGAAPLLGSKRYVKMGLSIEWTPVRAPEYLQKKYTHTHTHTHTCTYTHTHTYICIWWWWWFGTKSCPCLCNPMDCSLPGSSVHAISQAGKLEWVAISFSKGYSQPMDWTSISCIAGGFYTAKSPGKPIIFISKKFSRMDWKYTYHTKGKEDVACLKFY